MFQLLGVKDCGQTACPHCGAEGRYIISWIDDNGRHSAMTGCFKAMTNRIGISDIDSFILNASTKQAKGKKLNGWDKTVLRMIDYKNANASDNGKIAWADKKIQEAVSEHKVYCSKRRF